VKISNKLNKYLFKELKLMGNHKKDYIKDRKINKPKKAYLLNHTNIDIIKFNYLNKSKNLNYFIYIRNISIY